MRPGPMDSAKWWEMFRAANPEIDLPDAGKVVEATISYDAFRSLLVVSCINRGEPPNIVRRYTIEVEKHWPDTFAMVVMD